MSGNAGEEVRSRELTLKTSSGKEVSVDLGYAPAEEGVGPYYIALLRWDVDLSAGKAIVLASFHGDTEEIVLKGFMELIELVERTGQSICLDELCYAYISQREVTNVY